MSAIGNALVIGAGIGGLAAAVSLRKRGIAVDIVEIKERITVYGVGIIQPNNTLRALDRIGLAQACVDGGAPYPGWLICDTAGHVLMEAPGGSEAAPNFPPNNGITRPRLHEILVNAATEHGAHIRFGLTAGSMEDDGEGVDVTFTDGSSGRYDLVIGCDGLYSDLRRRLFPDAQGPRFTGQGVWRYNMPRPADVEWGYLFAGPSSKVGLVPLSPSQMYMLIVTQEPGSPRFDEAELAVEMRRRLDGFTGIVEQMKEHITDPAGVVYRPLEAHMLAAPWMVGRIVLIGDAAHGTTPHLAQGAAMAIEDGVLLGELMGRDEPVETLLDELMERRFARSKFVVDSSVQIGRWELDEWAGIHTPGADAGALLHSATLELKKPY